MFFKVFISFCLTNIVAVSSDCHLMSITECNKFDLVSEFKFPAFVPRDDWEETCTNMGIVLDCIYQPKYMDGCSIAETFFYDMQRDVSNAVCKDGKYLDHADCLGNKELENKIINDCINALSTNEVTCEVLKSTRTCVSNTILTQCGQQDSKYVDTLAYAFLKPYGESISCELAAPASMAASTTTTKATMTTRSSHKTTATTKKTTSGNTTPNAGSILTVPSLLIGVIAIKLTISINAFLYL